MNSSVKNHLDKIFELVNTEGDTARLEQTVSDMIYCFLANPDFYHLPIPMISRTIANSGETFTETNVKFILTSLSNAILKDATKSVDSIEIMSAEQLGALVAKVDQCPEMTSPLPVPESGFGQTAPPSSLELLRNYNKAQLESTRAKYEASLKDIRASIAKSQEDIEKAPERVKEAEEKAKLQLDEAKSKYQNEEETFQKKIDLLKSRYDDALNKLGENPEQRKFFEEYMEQQRAFLKEKSSLERRLNSEVAQIRTQVESYVKQAAIEKLAQELKAAAAQKEAQKEAQSSKKQKKNKDKKVEEPKKEEKPQRNEKKNQENDEDMMEGLVTEEEEDIDAPLTIPENPVPVRATSKPKTQPLPTKITNIFDAIVLGNVDEVRKFIEKKRSVVNERGNNRITPFTVAASASNLEIMKILYENGADPNVKDGNGRTAFHIAAAKESMEMISYLAEIKADIKIKDKDGRVPVEILQDRERSQNQLQEAIKEGDVRKLGEVLRKWPDLATHKFKSGITPLHLAAGFDTAVICEKLLQWGEDINVLDENGSTPLHYAVEYEAPHSARYLLKHAADATIKNKDGKLPLEMGEQQ